MTSALLAFLLALGLYGCAPTVRVQSSRSAQAVARAATTGLPAAVEAYRGEGERAIDAAPTLAAARASLEGVRARWRPFWTAWEHARRAQEDWSALLERHAEEAQIAAAADRFRLAYCEARASVPVPVLADLEAPRCP